LGRRYCIVAKKFKGDGLNQKPKKKNVRKGAWLGGTRQVYWDKCGKKGGFGAGRKRGGLGSQEISPHPEEKKERNIYQPGHGGGYVNAKAA